MMLNNCDLLQRASNLHVICVLYAAILFCHEVEAQCRVILVHIYVFCYISIFEKFPCIVLLETNNNIFILTTMSSLKVILQNYSI